MSPKLTLTLGLRYEVVPWGHEQGPKPDEHTDVRPGCRAQWPPRGHQNAGTGSRGLWRLLPGHGRPFPGLLSDFNQRCPARRVGPGENGLQQSGTPNRARLQPQQAMEFSRRLGGILRHHQFQSDGHGPEPGPARDRHGQHGGSEHPHREPLSKYARGYYRLLQLEWLLLTRGRHVVSCGLQQPHAVYYGVDRKRPTAIDGIDTPGSGLYRERRP